MVDLSFPVSLFRNCHEVEPIKTIPLISFFTITSPALEDKINKIRACCDKRERNAIKETLPCITVSGCFSLRYLANQISHSGFICIDIDRVEDVEEVKSKVSKLEYAALVSISSSGNGIFFICEVKHPDKHREHFDFIKKDVKDRLGLDIDKSCSDASRLRFYSWDEALYVNENASVVEGMIEQVRVKPKVRASKDSTKNRFFRLLDIIENTGVDITQDRGDWIKIGTGIANEFGEEGYAYFEAISAHFPGFSIRECKEQWRSLLRGAKSGKASLSSVFYIAKKYGVMLK